MSTSHYPACDAFANGEHDVSMDDIISWSYLSQPESSSLIGSPSEDSLPTLFPSSYTQNRDAINLISLFGDDNPQPLGTEQAGVSVVPQAEAEFTPYMDGTIVPNLCPTRDHCTTIGHVHACEPATPHPSDGAFPSPTSHGLLTGVLSSSSPSASFARPAVDALYPAAPLQSGYDSMSTAYSPQTRSSLVNAVKLFGQHIAVPVRSVPAQQRRSQNAVHRVSDRASDIRLEAPPSFTSRSRVMVDPYSVTYAASHVRLHPRIPPRPQGSHPSGSSAEYYATALVDVPIALEQDEIVSRTYPAQELPDVDYGNFGCRLVDALAGNFHGMDEPDAPALQNVRGVKMTFHYNFKCFRPQSRQVNVMRSKHGQHVLPTRAHLAKLCAREFQRFLKQCEKERNPFPYNLEQLVLLKVVRNRVASLQPCIGVLNPAATALDALSPITEYY